jgi:pimeloyl-ACP methyl ester carboxylesterase
MPRSNPAVFLTLRARAAKVGPMRIYVLAAAIALAAASPALGGDDDWERNFLREMAKPESWNRYEAVKSLDPKIPKAREHLITVLDKHHWWLRSGAIEALKGAAGDTAALDDLSKDLAKHSSPSVREGIALGFRHIADESRPKDLVAALADKDARVRRAAAIALEGHPRKESIAGLIDAWEKEKETEVAVFYRQTLEKLAKKQAGSKAEDWRAWWKAVEADWSPDAKPEEGKSSETTTTLRDVELKFKEAGEGGPLFVLPDYGLHDIYMQEHIRPLEDVARLFFIALPGVKQFKNLPVPAAGLPEYPIDKLCDAFDELRKERKQERIAILAHGISAWVAMRYATKFPKNVSHLILISTWTSGRTWGDGRGRAEDYGRKTGDIEFEHFAANCLLLGPGKHKYEPSGKDETEALRRASWTGYFTDVRNVFASLYWPEIDQEEEMGNVLVPDFDVGREKGNPVPTLIIYGASPRAIWTDPKDHRQLSKYYPNSTFIECPRANQLPMIEDHDLFMKAVRGFLKKHPFAKSKSGKP